MCRVALFGRWSWARVDGSSALSVVDDNHIRRIAEDGARKKLAGRIMKGRLPTIFVMASILVKMSTFPPCMISVVPSSEFGQERPWVFGQWMECQSIYDCGNKLRKLVSQLSIDNPLQLIT
jgi:hypothetical protein